MPLLLAFNLNSKSTPIRVVQTPNRSAPAKQRIISGTSSDNLQDEENDDNDQTKSSFSYNEAIRDYELNLLGPTKITLNHVITIFPSYADVKDGFGRIILHPETILSAAIFVYKNEKDGLPTLNLKNAVKDQNNEPILYQAVYSSSSYGTKDLSKIFENSLSKATQFYKEYCDTECKITEERLKMVNNILCDA